MAKNSDSEPKQIKELRKQISSLKSENRQLKKKNRKLESYLNAYDPMESEEQAPVPEQPEEPGLVCLKCGHKSDNSFKIRDVEYFKCENCGAKGRLKDTTEPNK